MGALASPAAAAGGPTDASGSPGTPAGSETAGLWTDLTPRSVWGGSSGAVLPSGRTRKTVVDHVPGLAASASALVVQVHVDSGAEGDLKLWAAEGAEPEAAVASFSSGASSFTAVVPLGSDDEIAMRSSSTARVAVTAIGYLSGAGASVTAGGITVIGAGRLVDQATGEGGAVPAPGERTRVPVAGLSGVPSAGVRAVWLAVQARGTGRGLVTTGPAEADAGIAYSTRWTTQLVLAPIDSSGSVSYGVTGAPSADLRISVVGWVADTTATTASPSAAGIVPIPTRSLAEGSGRREITLRVSEDDVPEAVSQLLVRVSVTTGRVAGRLDAGPRGRVEPVAPLASSTATTITAVVAVGSDGWLALRGPVGAVIRAVDLEGYVAEEHRGFTDRSAPALVITSPEDGASFDLATEPELVVTGTVEDTGSGVREVVVASEDGVLGLARVSSDSRSAEQTWSFRTSPPAGDHQLTVTAVDWAGRSVEVGLSFVAQAIDEDDVVVAPDVHVLTPEESGAILTVTASTLEFSGSSQLEPGAVIVASGTDAAPQGLLRRVESVQFLASSTIVRTQDAALTDALLSAHIEVTDVPLAPAAEASGEPAVSASVVSTLATVDGGVETPPITISTAPITNDDETLSLAFSNTLTLSVDFTLDIDRGLLGWSAFPRLNEMSLVFGARDTLELTAEATATLAEIGDRKIPLPKVDLGMVTVMAGPIPVVFVFTLDPYIYAKASVSVVLRTTATVTLSARIGVSYSDGRWTPIDQRDIENGFGASLTGEASVQAGAGLDFSAWLYGAAALYVGVREGLERTWAYNPFTGLVDDQLDLVRTVAVGGKVIGLADWSQELAEERIPIRRSEPTDLDVDWSGHVASTPFVLAKWPAGGQSAVGVCTITADFGGLSGGQIGKEYRVVLHTPPTLSPRLDRFLITLFLNQGYTYDCTLDVYDTADPFSQSAVLIGSDSGTWNEPILY